MTKKLELPIGEKSIELTVNDENWCSVTFHHGIADELGADTKEIVIQRFLSILEPSNFPENTHQLEGHKYTCFVMLFEKHASGYARLTDKGVKLHFRNSQGNRIDDIDLSYDDCKRWKKLLVDFRN